MTQIKTLDDLRKLRENLQNKIDMREKGLSPDKVVQVKVAMATCGIASGARETMNFFISALKKRHIEAVVTQTGCMGYCYAEPTIEVTLPGKQPVVFGYVDMEKADDIIENYIKLGNLVDGVIPVTYRNIEEK
jgi:NADP-reducing hydrogenase subunit HndB